MLAAQFLMHDASVRLPRLLALAAAHRLAVQVKSRAMAETLAPVARRAWTPPIAVVQPRIPPCPASSRPL